MIKYGDLLAGYEKGVVRFVREPGFDYGTNCNMGGTVCEIGNNWFYFSDIADCYEPEEMVACEGVRHMLEMVYSTLNTVGGLAAMDEVDPDEYAYYEAILADAGCTGHIA